MQTIAYFLAPLQHLLAKHVRQTSTGSVFTSLRTKPASQKQPRDDVATRDNFSSYTHFGSPNRDNS